MRHWLPDMPWTSVFGLDYNKMFGKERLLTTPAYRTEALSDEVVFIQLTPNMDDLWDEFDSVMEARERAKHHLGYDCFFQEKLSYDWREHPEKVVRYSGLRRSHLSMIDIWSNQHALSQLCGIDLHFGYHEWLLWIEQSRSGHFLSQQSRAPKVGGESIQQAKFSQPQYRA
jgi:hypothetical protein